MVLAFIIIWLAISWTVLLSSAPVVSSMEQLLTGRVQLLHSHLDIKWVAMEFVETLEFLAVCLVHGQGVLFPLKHLLLIGLLQTTPGKVPLLGDSDRAGDMFVVTTPPHLYHWASACLAASRVVSFWSVLS